MITYWAMFHLLWQVGGKDEHAESNSILQTRGEMFAGGKRWWENILSGSPRGGRKSNWNYEVAFRVKEGNFARTYPNSFSEDRGPFPREEKRHRPTHAFFREWKCCWAHLKIFLPLPPSSFDEFQGSQFVLKLGSDPSPFTSAFAQKNISPI